MPYFAYILRSQSTGRFYYGHAKNVTERLAYHNSGRVASTRNRGPWEVFHCEQFETRAEAARREREWKAAKNPAWIKQVVRASR